jgi:UDP-N-acetylmuramoyl-tripeptide--D-alanyl-D-alanine ligase
VARHLGLADERIISALAQAHGPEMRLEVVRVGEVTIINDAYNANPGSMEAALETLAALPCPAAGRRIAVLGEMRELGPWTEQLHRRVGQFVAAHPPDLVCCLGELAGLIGQEARQAGLGPERVVHFSDAAAAAAALPRMVSAGDVVLLKASRAVRLESLAAALAPTSAPAARKSA